MSNYILCDKYLIKDRGSKEKPKRLMGIFSFNQYGDQGKDKYSYHVHSRKNGVEVIPGQRAELLDLKWYHKDTYWAGIMGGVIGFLSSLAVLGLKNLLKL